MGKKAGILMLLAGALVIIGGISTAVSAPEKQQKNQKPHSCGRGTGA